MVGNTSGADVEVFGKSQKQNAVSRIEEGDFYLDLYSI